MSLAVQLYQNKNLKAIELVEDASRMNTRNSPLCMILLDIFATTWDGEHYYDSDQNNNSVMDDQLATKEKKKRSNRGSTIKSIIQPTNCPMISPISNFGIRPSSDSTNQHEEILKAAKSSPPYNSNK